MRQTGVLSAEQHLTVLVAAHAGSPCAMRMAHRLRVMTCGVLFPIETQCSGSGFQGRCREREKAAFPQLLREPPDMRPYDLVLVGGPLWLGSLSPALRVFLRRTDFKGRAVAAFCTLGEEGKHYLAEFRNVTRNAVVMQGLHLAMPCFGSDTSGLLHAWLHKLYTQTRRKR